MLLFYSDLTFAAFKREKNKFQKHKKRGKLIKNHLPWWVVIVSWSELKLDSSSCKWYMKIQKPVFCLPHFPITYRFSRQDRWLKRYLTVQRVWQFYWRILLLYQKKTTGSPCLSRFCLSRILLITDFFECFKQHFIAI